jgi:hypothetical protein
MARSTPSPHVAVIGRHTLRFVLALLSHGCACVRSLRPDTAAPDCEAADLAWIVDAHDAQELGEALRAAHRRTGARGRIVLEQAACRHCEDQLGRHAKDAGLDIVSFDPIGGRRLLAHH